MKFYRFFPAVVILLSLVPGAKAQIAGHDPYTEHTIYLTGVNRYVKNNTVYAGHKSLLNEFLNSPAGLNLYVRSRRNRNIGMAVSLLGTAGTIYALVNRNRVNWRPFFWASIGTGLIAAPLNMTATKQLNQAVWIRNRDELQRTREN